MGGNEPADMGERGPGAQPGDSILDAVGEAFEPRPPAYPPPGGAAEPATTQARGDPSPLLRRRDASSAIRFGRRPSLFSPSPEERRGRLSELASTGVEAGQVEAIARVLTADPDPDIRIAAARLLEEASRKVPLPVLARALADPHDGVRSAVVRLAAAHGAEAVPILLPLVTQRRWPATQSAALEVAPDLLGPGVSPSDSELERLLTSVGSLDPPPLPMERPGLESLSRAVGPSRLARWFGTVDITRLGAARLTMLARTPPALRALATLADDPLDEIRILATSAARLAHEATASTTPPSDRPPDTPHAAMAPPLRAEEAEPAIIASLARALTDPAQPVRGQAQAALERIPRTLVAGWVERALGQEETKEADLAAQVAGRLGIASAGKGLFDRAAGAPTEARGPYLTALLALRLAPAELVRMASEVEPAHRQTAVSLAWQVGGRGVLPHLSELLADSAGAVRMAVIEVLSESADPSIASLAMERLANDASAAVRATAIHALSSADVSVRQGALSKALSDPDPDVRSTAVEALPNGSPQFVELLFSALRDEDEPVWRAALTHLAALPGPDLATVWAALKELPDVKRGELIRALERTGPGRLVDLAGWGARSATPADRALAVDLAARAGSAEATNLVVAALQDPHPLVRRTAAAAMTMLRAPAAVPALARSLSDPQAEVRVEAVRALGLIDDDAVPDRLITCLKDPEVRVRQMAADALARWHSPAVARRLAAALRSPDLRRPAGEVLERMGSVAAEALSEVAVGPDPEAAAAAGSLVDRIVGTDPFVDGLSSIDPEERIRSVQVLGAIGGPAASEALMGALPDPDVRVRARAAFFLGTLGYLPAVKSLRRMFLTDPVADAAAAAEAALRTLGTVPPGEDDVRIVEDVGEDLSEPPPD